MDEGRLEEEGVPQAEDDPWREQGLPIFVRAGVSRGNSIATANATATYETIRAISGCCQKDIQMEWCSALTKSLSGSFCILQSIYIEPLLSCAPYTPPEIR